ncbi:MAG: hypothetical protein NT169_01535 [Chloroflexi bacterium]|nr:hypothetical protein [Chloroflexota bacterium]
MKPKPHKPVDAARPLARNRAKTAFHAERGEEPERPSGAVDTTTHLLRSDVNRKRLLAAIENINAGRNLVEAPLDMLR